MVSIFRLITGVRTEVFVLAYWLPYLLLPVFLLPGLNAALPFLVLLILLCQISYPLAIASGGKSARLAYALSAMIAASCLGILLAGPLLGAGNEPSLIWGLLPAVLVLGYLALSFLAYRSLTYRPSYKLVAVVYWPVL